MTQADFLVPALGAFIAATLLSLVLTPLVRRLAHRVDVVDHPEARRVNTRPIARGGGVAVAVAFLVVGGSLLVLDATVGLWKPGDAPASRGLTALFIGGAVAVVLGLLDDRFNLRARWQLGGQVAVALIPVALGISVGVIANPFGPGVIRLEGVFGALFVVVWIVGMINSVNFIDGLDGLSAGVGFIAAMTLAIISLYGPGAEPVVALLCVTLAGALLGFLRWNFHPASVFIGTSGVMFVGYTLALLSILGNAKVAVALLVLGVPIIDTFYTIVRRLRAGRSPFSPDRGHIHHRLLDIGLSHTQTVLVIYGLCVGLGALALVLSGSGQLYAFLGVFVVFGVVIILLDRAIESRDDEDEVELRAVLSREAASRAVAPPAGEPREAAEAAEVAPRAVAPGAAAPREAGEG